MSPRVSFFICSLAVFWMFIYAKEACAEATVFVISWSPVTLTIDGEALPAEDVEYMVYGRRNEGSYQIGVITTDTEWTTTAVPVGCYDFYVVARRIASGLESDPSLIVSECVYPNDAGTDLNSIESPGPVQPEIAMHSPPASPSGVQILKRQVNW